jgi:hypothetical protein
MLDYLTRFTCNRSATRPVTLSEAPSEVLTELQEAHPLTPHGLRSCSKCNSAQNDSALITSEEVGVLDSHHPAHAEPCAATILEVSIAVTIDEGFVRIVVQKAVSLSASLPTRTVPNLPTCSQNRINPLHLRQGLCQPSDASLVARGKGREGPRQAGGRSNRMARAAGCPWMFAATGRSPLSHQQRADLIGSMQHVLAMPKAMPSTSFRLRYVSVLHARVCRDFAHRTLLLRPRCNQ